jgi:hypothetical protein
MGTMASPRKGARLHAMTIKRLGFARKIAPSDEATAITLQQARAADQAGTENHFGNAANRARALAHLFLTSDQISRIPSRR